MSTSSCFFSDVIQTLDISGESISQSKPSASKLNQTDPVSRSEAGTQSKIAVDQESQCESGSNPMDTTALSGGSKLESFLAKVSPMVEQQLIQNCISTAFQDYTVQWDQSKENITPLHRLKRKIPVKPQDFRQMSVSALSWNCTGNTIAAGMGHTDHTDLCAHTSTIAIWNISRKFVKEETPDIIIETQACVTAAEFHPTVPTRLAVGTFNGGVFVMDLLNTDTIEFSNVLGDFSHREPVADVSWIYDPVDRDHKLVSVAGDGRVCVWSLSNKLARPVAVLDLGSDGGRIGGGGGRFQNRQKQLGGTSVSVPPLEPGTFYVATERGDCYKCLVDFADIQSRNKSQSSVAVSSSVKIAFAFEQAQGAMCSIQSSPFNRKVISAVATDGVIKIYNTVTGGVVSRRYVPAAAHHSLSFSHSRPHVFAASSLSSVYVYDLQNENLSPEVRLDLTPDDESYTTATTEKKKAEEVSALSLAFNPSFADIIAVGSSIGSIQIWQLNSLLTEMRANEVEVFEATVLKV